MFAHELPTCVRVAPRRECQSTTRRCRMYRAIRTMPSKSLVLLLTVFACSECALIYSSFWAPLFDRRILNYRVEVPFEPSAGTSARQQYAKEYGYRGETLIADLGNGKGPRNSNNQDKVKIQLVQQLGAGLAARVQAATLCCRMSLVVK